MIHVAFACIPKVKFQFLEIEFTFDTPSVIYFVKLMQMSVSFSLWRLSQIIQYIYFGASESVGSRYYQSLRAFRLLIKTLEEKATAYRDKV